jgi:predicted RNA polymerase sigma factor
VKQLTEVGFLAASVGDLVHAREIFGPLAQLRPTSSFPALGLAVALLNAHLPDEALLELDQALRRSKMEDKADLHVFRALSLQALGRLSESEGALQHAPDHPLARSLQGLPLEKTQPQES